MQVVQGHGGDEGQHSILVWDLHGDVDSEGGKGRTVSGACHKQFMGDISSPNPLCPHQ